MASSRGLDFEEELKQLTESIQARQKTTLMEPEKATPTPAQQEKKEVTPVVTITITTTLRKPSPQPLDLTSSVIVSKPNAVAHKLAPAKKPSDLASSVLVSKPDDVIPLQFIEDYQPGYTSSTSYIMTQTNAANKAISGVDVDTFSIDIFNIPPGGLEKIHTGETNVLRVFPHACDWKELEYEPKEYSSFIPDSYLIIKKTFPWKVLYLDERKKVNLIELDKLPKIKKYCEQINLYENKTKDIDVNQLCEEDLADYRKKIQGKEIRDTQKAYWLKFGNREILLMEVFNANLYNLMCNDSPEATVCINSKGDIAALATEELTGFLPLADAPLKETDLPITVFDNGYTKAQIFQDMRQFELSFPEDGNMKSMLDKHTLFEIQVNDNPKTKVPVTVRDFKNYLQQKRLATSIMSSYLLDEADLHRNNIGKFSLYKRRSTCRIDYDCSLYRISRKYKRGKVLLEDTYRNTKANTFKKHWEDMKTCPVLFHSTPWYFPGNTRIGPGKNTYSQQENKVFAELAFKPVFYYYKLKNILRLLLISREMCQRIADRKIPPEYKSLKDEFVNEAVKIQKEAWDEVIRWEKSKKFNSKVLDWEDALVQYGNQWLKEIIEEFEEKNAKVRNNHEKIKIDEVEARYKQLSAEVIAASKEREEKKAAEVQRKNSLKNSGNHSGSGKNFLRP